MNNDYSNIEKVMVEEDNIRSTFNKQFDTDFRIRIIDDLEKKRNESLSSDEIKDIIKKPSYCKIMIPSTVNDELIVDELIKTSKKSFVLEFKAPYIYRRQTRSVPKITAEMKWKQIEFMKGLSTLTSCFGSNEPVEASYYIIPTIKNIVLDEMANEEILSLRDEKNDIMGINEGNIGSYLNFCPSQSIILKKECTHQKRHHKSDKKPIVSIWGKNFPNYVFKYDTSDALLYNKIKPVEPGCDILEIVLNKKPYSYQKFFDDVYNLPNPGSKYTPISIYLINKLLEFNGDKNKLKEIYSNLVQKFSRDIIYKDFKEINAKLKNICPSENYLVDLRNWIKNTRLFIIARYQK